MIRVIKLGRVPPKIVKCKGCGAELQYMACDVKKHINQGRDKNTGALYYEETGCIDCPLCDYRIELTNYRSDKNV